MSGAGSALYQRLTIGWLRSHEGVTTDLPFTKQVTFTSVATSLDDVCPGCLFVPAPQFLTKADVQEAAYRGAYGVLLPQPAEIAEIFDQQSARQGEDAEPASAAAPTVAIPRGVVPAESAPAPALKAVAAESTAEVNVDANYCMTVGSELLGIPVLRAARIPAKLGEISAYLETDPSERLAVFIVAEQAPSSTAEKLASLLHALGNPVGLLNAGGQSYSVNRPIAVDSPLGAERVQALESIILEDGAAAIVIAVNDSTLRDQALVGTHIDICGGLPESPKDFMRRYGIELDSQARRVDTAQELPADLLTTFPGADTALRTAVMMTLAAGVTHDSLRKAMSVSREFIDD